MSVLRQCKTVLVALAASYISMVLFNNITDYVTYLGYIQHVPLSNYESEQAIFGYLLDKAK